MLPSTLLLNWNWQLWVKNLILCDRRVQKLLGRYRLDFGKEGCHVSLVYHPQGMLIVLLPSGLTVLSWVTPSCLPLQDLVHRVCRWTIGPLSLTHLPDEEVFDDFRFLTSEYLLPKSFRQYRKLDSIRRTSIANAGSYLRHQISVSLYWKGISQLISAAPKVYAESVWWVLVLLSGSADTIYACTTEACFLPDVRYANPKCTLIGLAFKSRILIS